jgi:hypothetical protein
MYENAMVSFYAQNQAKENIRAIKRKERRDQDDFLNKLAINSRTCYEATNTAKLISESWDDDKTNYKIMTKLTPRLQMRIDDIIRYGVPK